VKSIVHTLVPGKIRYQAWRTGAKLYYAILDWNDKLRGNSDPSMPSRSQAFIYGFAGKDLRYHFDAAGQMFMTHFKASGKLQPDHSVLEIGCGIGRIAMPLTQYLGEAGNYEGMDIVPDAIMWCQEHITTQYPNFQFRHINIYNKMYNPKGQGKATDYRFPFQEEAFDFIFLISVFTHMLPDELENYLAEIARMLKKGGRCLITYFLLNEVAHQGIAAGKNAIPMEHRTEEYWARNKHIPEEAIAFEEDRIRGLYAKYGLRIDEPIYYGMWSGRAGVYDWQDIIVAIKE
jgi:ubiquinone/menaquinone biosynthesis C-methylase UbiE